VAAVAAIGSATVVVPAHAGVRDPAATSAARAASKGATDAAGVRIWPLGDSITIGVSWPTSTPGGYRAALDQILTHDGFDHLFVGTSTVNPSPTLSSDGQVRHDGHGGYRVDQVVRDLDGVARGTSDDGGRWLTGTRRRPPLSMDAVLLHLGTNDILQRWDNRRFPTTTGRAQLENPGQRKLFVADLTRRLGALVARIHELRPDVEIVVATAVPIDIPAYDVTAADYAAKVRGLVAVERRRHLPVVLADSYAAFTSASSKVLPGLLSVDKIHPTAAGYAVLARTFALAVERRTLPLAG
jgi:lysophospholipase L1-like esterase